MMDLVGIPGIVLIEGGIKGIPKPHPALSAIVLVDAGTNDKINIQRGSIELPQIKNKRSRIAVLPFKALIGIKMVKDVIGNGFLVLPETERDLLPFPITNGKKLSSIKIDIPRSLRFIKIVAADRGDLDDVPIAHDIPLPIIKAGGRFINVNHVLMKMVLLGIDNRLKITGRIKRETKRPKNDMIGRDISVIKKKEGKKQPFFLENITIPFLFIHNPPNDYYTIKQMKFPFRQTKRGYGNP